MKVGIEGNPHYKDFIEDSNLPVCYSCGFNKLSNGKLINMCKVLTTRDGIQRDFVESSKDGDILVDFCVPCVLYGYSSGSKAAIEASKRDGRYEYSKFWKVFEETINEKSNL